MRTCMQEDDTATRSRLQCGDHAVEVEHLGLCGEVGVCLDGEVDIGEDLVVVGPCRGGEVDGGCRLQEFGQEETTEMDGACARDGLQ